MRGCLSRMLVVALALAGSPPPAYAGLIGTERAVAPREKVLALLERNDLQALLAARGVSAEAASVRVAALSDAEAAGLAAQIDSDPAGGALSIGLIVLLAIALYFILASAAEEERAGSGRR